MTEIRWFDRTLTDMPVPAGDAWRTWCRRMCVDVNETCVRPGWIERDTDARQVRYLRYALDDSGRRYLYGHGSVAREVAVVQLESAPLPFPEEDI